MTYVIDIETPERLESNLATFSTKSYFDGASEHEQADNCR